LFIILFGVLFALALQEIQLADCPTVGVRKGAAFVRDGTTGSWVERLPPRGQDVRNEEEMQMLKVFIDLLAQAQALERPLGNPGEGMELAGRTRQTER
jgi:hypothetical protein